MELIKSSIAEKTRYMTLIMQYTQVGLYIVSMFLGRWIYIKEYKAKKKVKVDEFPDRGINTNIATQKE